MKKIALQQLFFFFFFTFMESLCFVVVEVEGRLIFSGKVFKGSFV